MSEINLLDDVVPASNELGAISDMAQQMYDLQEEIMKLELIIGNKRSRISINWQLKIFLTLCKNLTLKTLL